MRVYIFRFAKKIDVHWTHLCWLTPLTVMLHGSTIIVVHPISAMWMALKRQVIFYTTRKNIVSSILVLKSCSHSKLMIRTLFCFNVTILLHIFLHCFVLKQSTCIWYVVNDLGHNLCLKCNEVVKPKECSKVVRCGDDQVRHSFHQFDISLVFVTFTFGISSYFVSVRFSVSPQFLQIISVSIQLWTKMC